MDRRLIVQWSDVGQYNDGLSPTEASTFQIVLFEDNTFELRYLNVSPKAGARGPGDTTTVGYEDLNGTVGYQLPETRATLGAQCPIGFRGTGIPLDLDPCDSGPSCAACAADFDQDGGVTGADVAGFFDEYERGLPCADLDQNGGIDGADLGLFFTLFEAGGC